MGAKETWYDVRLVVDSVYKEKLKHAKRPVLGMLPLHSLRPSRPASWQPPRSSSSSRQ